MPRGSIDLFSNSSQPQETKTPDSEAGQYRKQVYSMIEGVTKTPFSHILTLPKVFSFQARNIDEKIIMVVRQHWFINLKWICIFLIMFFGPIVFNLSTLFAFIPSKFHFSGIFFWYLLTFIIAFEGFLSWWFNVFIITEERIVDIDFYNLLNTKVSDAQIDRIQDVTYEIAGISGTFLNYGNITIQTASEVPEIEINNAPNPNLITKVLQTLRLEEQQEALDGRLK